MNSRKRKVMRECEKLLGPVAESIVNRQAEKLYIDLDSMDKHDLEKLANAISQNAVLLVGRPRAEAVRERLMEMAETM